MKLASKSQNRIAILDMIQDGISTNEIFETIDYKKQSEDKIKQSIYPNLLNRLTDYVMEKKGFSRSLAREKAKTMIKWEGSSSTAVRNIQFMGTSNKPNMTVDIEGVKIAIEVKKGNRGSNLREGFGQSVIYSTIFDFVLYLFIDTSEDSRILNGSIYITEENFLEKIWNNFNVKFVIV
jgi:Zn/Cd-binding protein ZinT